MVNDTLKVSKHTIQVAFFIDDGVLLKYNIIIGMLNWILVYSRVQIIFVVACSIRIGIRIGIVVVVVACFLLLYLILYLCLCLHLLS